MTLYHVTKKEFLSEIFSEGLKPAIGESGRLVNERRIKIWLCRKRDIPFWMILTGGDTVLKINSSKYEELKGKALEDNIDLSFNYELYHEFGTKERIPPEALEVVKRDFSQTKKEAMRALCKNAMEDLSFYCVEAARFDKYNKEGAKAFVDGIVGYLNAIAHTLDFSCFTDREKKKILRDYAADGEYTFVDTYEADERGCSVRLYEKLLEYEASSNVKEVYQKLYNIISNNF